MAEYLDRELVIENVIAQMKHSGELAMRERIMNLVTADVLPVRHGRWRLGGYGQISDAKIKWHDQFLQGGFLYCSECKGRKSLKTNYGPNCGAKMDGGKT